jgi:hypothetical protein
MTRFHASYREVFDATVSAEMTEREEITLSFVDIGPTAKLNVFQVVGNHEAEHQTPMFGRGRIDHLGLEADPSRRLTRSDND